MLSPDQWLWFLEILSVVIHGESPWPRKRLVTSFRMLKRWAIKQAAQEK